MREGGSGHADLLWRDGVFIERIHRHGIPPKRCRGNSDWNPGPSPAAADHAISGMGDHGQHADPVHRLWIPGVIGGHGASGTVPDTGIVYSAQGVWTFGDSDGAAGSRHADLRIGHRGGEGDFKGIEVEGGAWYARSGCKESGVRSMNWMRGHRGAFVSVSVAVAALVFLASGCSQVSEPVEGSIAMTEAYESSVLTTEKPLSAEEKADFDYSSFEGTWWDGEACVVIFDAEGNWKFYEDFEWTDSGYCLLDEGGAEAVCL